MTAPLGHCDTFLWGTATSAHQVEGNNLHNDWHDFQARRRTRVGEAADFARRFATDLDAARDLGTNTFRLSLEWSRVEPRPGERDPAAVAYYERLVDACVARGLRPMLTLLHFTLPRWCAGGRDGGWLAPDTHAAFARHVAWVAARFGDRVDLFVTLNEPNVVAGAGYLSGVFPPGRLLQFRKADMCLVALLSAHATAYRVLHETIAARHPNRSVRVGVSPHLVSPRASPWDFGGAIAHMTDRFNWAFLDAISTGEIVLPTVRTRAPEAEGTADFVGMNYFMGMRTDLGGALELAGLRKRRVGPATSEIGWPIDPDGLERVAIEAHRRYGLPIAITENGIADATDARRAHYLVAHVAALGRAAAAGAKVFGYYHWSLIDNHEWLEGFGARFGLFAVDYATQQRTARPSAEVYRRIIAAGGVHGTQTVPRARDFEGAAHGTL